MPSTVAQTTHTPLALNQDFAHHSQGRWKGQKFRPVPPLKARTPPQRLKAAVGRLRQHVARALGPQAPRIAHQCRSSLKRTDTAMSLLLGGLLRGATDTRSVADTLHRFVASAQYLTGTHQVTTLPQLLDIRAEVLLAHMTGDELQRLASQVKLAITDSALSDHPNSLQVLGVLTGLSRQVDREVGCRAVRGAVEAALEAVPQGAKAVARHFAEAFQAADGVLKKMGMPQDGSQAAKSRAYSLLKELLAHQVSKGDLSSDSLGALFRALPSLVQSELLASDKPTLFNSAQSIDALLKTTIRQQWTHLEQAVEGHRSTLAKMDPTADVPRFIDTLSQLAMQWSALKEHTEQHRLPADAHFESYLTDLVAQLSHRLGRDTLPLKDLQSQQLVTLATGLRSLGVEGDGVDALTAEMRLRKQNSLKTPGNHLLNACDRLLEARLPQALNQLAQAMDATIGAREAHSALAKPGTAPWNGPEGYTAFLEHLIHRVLDRHDAPPLANLQALFGSAETQVLIEALQQAGQALLDIPDPKGDRILKMGMALELVSAELAQRAGGAATTTPPDPARIQAACQAVYAFSGIRVFPSGQATVVYGAPMAAFQRNLDAMLEKPAPAFTPLGEKNSSGVSEAMYLDLKRATYAIEFADGYSEQLFGAREAFRIDRLRSDANLSAEELLGLSQVANQNLWAGLIAPETSPEDSAVRLPDGTPVNLVGEPKSTFTVRRDPLGDPQGRLFVRCEHELRPAVALQPNTGQITPLDSDQSSAWFSVEYEIGKDGRVRMTKPLICSYALVPAAA